MNARHTAWRWTRRCAAGAALVGVAAISSRAADQTAPPPAPEANEAAAEEPATVRVKGVGWFRARELRNALRLLEPEDEAPPRPGLLKSIGLLFRGVTLVSEIDAPFVEDGAVILRSGLEEDGFLRSSGRVVVRDDEQLLGEFPWGPNNFPDAPRTLLGDEAVFHLEPGVRYRIETLEFEGLSAVPEKEARGFFIEEGFLLGGAGARRFTPARLRRGLDNLREQLIRLGYAEALVEAREPARDDETGNVRVHVRVSEGPRHEVLALQTPPDLPPGPAPEIEKLAKSAIGAVYSPLWQQDFLQQVRTAYYAHGYAEAEARLEPAGETKLDTIVQHTLALEVEPGRQIRVGEVRFAGADDTKDSVLRRAIDVQPGQLFNRNAIQRDRLQLSALGVFSSVRAEVEPVDADEWNLTYQLTPGKRLEVSLLAGYGSYEQLRGGVEVFHANLFERAHRGRLQLIQSMKSSSGDYLYTIPQVLGSNTDASIRLFGLSREEVSFDREEFGASLGLSRHLEWIGADAALRYQFESVNAEITDETLAEDAPTDSRVASLTLDLTRDRRDNPLVPRRGHFAGLTLETAAAAIGGQVNYQRLDVRGSWHRRIDSERYLHLGLRHGLIWSLGAAEEEIPLGKRYLPGGESTVRGYREGRAAPRNEEGAVLGAEVSTILNVELEQALTRQLSVVAFLDAGLTSLRLDDYPGDEWRVSAGLGLRYNTVIGPVRLEYGHNIVREPRDQVGALHFSLGFPF